MVQKLEGNALLNMLGVVAVRIAPPSFAPSPYFFHLEVVKANCGYAKEAGALTDDQITTIMADCEALGVKPNFQAVVDAIGLVKLPTDPVSNYQFRPCEGCDRPIPHGNVFLQDRKFPDQFSSVEQGFRFLYDADQNITPEEMIHLLQQMITVLPIDAAARQILIDALPPDQQKRLQSQIPSGIQAALSVMFGGVPVEIIEL